MTSENLSLAEIVELVDYIAKVYPDDVEQARGQLEDIADLTRAYLEGASLREEEE